MGSSVLDNKTLITFHTLEDSWLLYGPFSNICPFLIFVRAFGVLLGMRWLPSGLPVICELLDEISLYFARLYKVQSASRFKANS
jgi:hypothetical protein